MAAAAAVAAAEVTAHETRFPKIKKYEKDHT